MTPIIPIDPQQIAAELKRELSKYPFPENIASSVEIWPQSLDPLVAKLGLRLIIEIGEFRYIHSVSFADFLHARVGSSGVLEAAVRRFVRSFEAHQCKCANSVPEEQKLCTIAVIALVSRLFDLHFPSAKRLCDRWIERNYEHACDNPRAWNELHRLLSSGRIQLIEGVLCRVSPIASEGIEPWGWSGNLPSRNFLGEQLIPDRELDQIHTDFLLGLRSFSRPPEQARPETCQGCTNFYGGTDGDNRLICGMHPYGWDASIPCPDWSNR